MTTKTKLSTADPFLGLDRPLRHTGARSPVVTSAPAAVLSGAEGHAGRAHSKFSASGAERWMNCPGSVALSEGLPDKSSPWAEEGTRAHEVLEFILDCETEVESEMIVFSGWIANSEMVRLGKDAARFIKGIHNKEKASELLVETRVYLDFIHPEMFGTFDAAVVDHFGTLHVFDYKYGAGVFVSPRENLQMLFYGIGMAHQYQWNFKKIRLWIIQPRVKGYDGPLFWDVPILEARARAIRFEAAVKDVQRSPHHFEEGSWCHWCKAKAICPLKRGRKLEEAKMLFGGI